MQKKILITGGAGFVGSSLAISLKNDHPDYTICCLDNLKRRGSELNVPRLAKNGIEFIHGDVRSREDILQIDSGFTTIIEASAEPSVLAGLNDAPEYLIDTNLNGTINCLYLAARIKADFIFLSTSRVYPIGDLEKINFTEEKTRFAISTKQSITGISQKGITEQFPLFGFRSLYGATKLSSELMISEFNQFYNFKTVINRCGVIAGPWQMGKVDQGVAVLWVARHLWKKPLQYIGYGGKGKQVRDILDVTDLYKLIDYQVHHMDSVNGKTFNVGGGVDNSLSLLELTDLCRQITGNTIPIDEISETRQADIRIYVTDNAFVKEQTGWEPLVTNQKTLSSIFSWLKENEAALKPILGK